MHVVFSFPLFCKSSPENTQECAVTPSSLHFFQVDGACVKAGRGLQRLRAKTGTKASNNLTHSLASLFNLLLQVNRNLVKDASPPCLRRLQPPTGRVPMPGVRNQK